MRIAYVAKHDSGGNDDEGAITYALEQLGHEVIRIQERRGHLVVNYLPDFVLFHKWFDQDTLRKLRCPRVFWYFDLVHHRDQVLRQRCIGRIHWMNCITPLVDLGFCTDGDWVAHDHSGKLVHLPQGADARIIGQACINPTTPTGTILFTGIRSGGRTRTTFVDEMRYSYRDRFIHITNGAYRLSLASAIASSDIVVAPDGPVTNLYWSNRVYMALGFGAFMLHPYCSKLTEHYEHFKEIVYYETRIELHDLIDRFTSVPLVRQAIAKDALDRTAKEHTYTHRCQQLIEVVKERLKI